jgi:putative peptidoglycan lipid II flippase
MKSFFKKDSVFSVMLILLFTKVLGFVKLRTFAQLFGASHQLDIFWASFTIPDIIFMILVAGSVNAAVLPILTDVLYDKGKKDLNRLFLQITEVFFGLSVLMVGVIFIFAPQITTAIVSNDSLQQILNFSSRISTDDYDLFIKLLRIGLLSPLALGVSGFITAYLQVRKRFFITSLAPLFYNVAMIIGPMLLVKSLGMGVEAIAISAVAGSFLHLLIQLPDLFKYLKTEGVKRFSIFKVTQSKNVRKTFKLAFPRTLGIFGEQVNVIVNTVISFTLPAGALSAYKFAYSLHLFPVNIIGSAIAQVTMPDLAEFSCKNQKDEFRKALNNALQFSLYLVLPIVSVMLVLRLPIVRLIYGTGAFDWQDTLITAWSLALLSISVIGQTVVQLVLRAFYALQDTWRPLIAIVIGIVINLLGAYYLTNFFSHYYDWRPILEQIFIQIKDSNGTELSVVLASFFSDTWSWMNSRGDSTLAVGGLALSLSLSYFAQMIISIMLLNKKVSVFSWKETMYPILLKLLNSAIMIMGMYFVFRLFDLQLDTSRTIQVIVLTIVVTIYGGLSYLVGSMLLSQEEFKQFEKLLKKLLKRFKRKI